MSDLTIQAQHSTKGNNGAQLGNITWQTGTNRAIVVFIGGHDTHASTRSGTTVTCSGTTFTRVRNTEDNDGSYPYNLRNVQIWVAEEGSIGTGTNWAQVGNSAQNTLALWVEFEGWDASENTVSDAENVESTATDQTVVSIGGETMTQDLDSSTAKMVHQAIEVLAEDGTTHIFDVAEAFSASNSWTPDSAQSELDDDSQGSATFVVSELEVGSGASSIAGSAAVTLAATGDLKATGILPISGTATINLAASAMFVTDYPILEGSVWSAQEDNELALTAPSGIAAGNLLLLLVGTDAPNTTTWWPALSGWTLEYENGSTAADVVLGLYSKVATGSEGDVTITGMASTQKHGGFYQRWSNAESVEVISAAVNASSTPQTTATLTTLTAESILVAHWVQDGQDTSPSTVSGTGWPTTPDEDEKIGTSGLGLSSGYVTKEQPTAAFVDRPTITGAVSDGIALRLFAINPPAAASGDTSGSAEIELAATGALTAIGALSGSASLDLVASGAVTSTLAASGSAAVDLVATGALAALGALSGGAALEFPTTGVLTALGALSGSAEIDLVTTASLTGLGAVAGSAAVELAATGALTALGTVAGSADLDLVATGDLTAAADDAVAGTAALDLVATGALTALGALSGSAGISLTATGALAGSGLVSGSASLTLTATAPGTAIGALAGSAAITLDATAGVGSDGDVAGSAALEVVGSGSLTALGYMSGSASIALDATAAVRGLLPASGTAVLRLTVTGFAGDRVPSAAPTRSSVLLTPTVSVANVATTSSAVVAGPTSLGAVRATVSRAGTVITSFDQEGGS